MSSSFEGWKRPVKVTIVQNEVRLHEPGVTFDRTMDICDEAISAERPDLIVLPESFVSGFPYDDVPGSAEISLAMLPRIALKARSAGASFLFSLPIAQEGKVFNRSFWIDAEGKVRGTYDKTHLFSRSGEDRHFSRGEGLRIFVVHGIPLGVLTCYEMRYPELARALAISGAGAIAYLAEWPAARVHQWDAMLRSRAIENQLYTIGANICGTHGDTAIGGRSAIVEPYGSTLASLDSSEGFCTATIDRERIVRFREGIPQESDRRGPGIVSIIS